jgi:hypothetical protein
MLVRAGATGMCSGWTVTSEPDSATGSRAGPGRVNVTRTSTPSMYPSSTGIDAGLERRKFSESSLALRVVDSDSEVTGSEPWDRDASTQHAGSSTHRDSESDARPWRARQRRAHRDLGAAAALAAASHRASHFSG